MRRNLFTNEKGFSLLELLIAVLVAITLLSTVGVGIMRAYDIKWKNETRNNLQKLVNACKTHYMEMRENASRYDQPVFFWNNRSILPLVITDTQTNEPDLTGSDIRIYSTNRSAFLEAGCSIVSSNGEYTELSCEDSFGTPLRIQAVNQRITSSKSSYQDLGSPYFLPSQPVEVLFRSAGPDRQFATEDDLTAFFSSSELDSYYTAETERKMQNILQAVKEFHSQRLFTETVELTYENSLSSYDDVRVPWVWQLYSLPGNDPKTRCVINNIVSCRPGQTCQCPYSSSQWPSVSYSQWDSNHVVYSQYAMMNLGLIPAVSNNYMVRDEFGMVMVLDLLSGSSLSPPVPHDKYSWDISPPYLSRIKTSWGKEMSIVLVN
ncbi:MAG: type II secretion system protein [Nitrospirae bacterium]|nr:type II secretion system protein [Nitrospirota bacterium]